MNKDVRYLRRQYGATNISILLLRLNISLAHSQLIQTDWLFAPSAFIIHKPNSFKFQITKFLSKFTYRAHISFYVLTRTNNQNQERTQYTEHGTRHFSRSDYLQIWQTCVPLTNSRIDHNYERSCQYFATFHVRTPLIHLLLFLVF